MTKLCSTHRCLNKARPGQRYCRKCHAAKAVKYRAKKKRELARLRKAASIGFRHLNNYVSADLRKQLDRAEALLKSK